MLAALRTLLGSRSGVTAIEYAFIASLVAVVIAAVFKTLGSEVSGLFTSVLGGF
ncbi:MAG: Flp family type IVb pilin [Stellaceae bacterium]